METEIISVSTLTDKEEVAHQLRKYDLLALPVLDNDGLLVGIVTFDDAHGCHGRRGNRGYHQDGGCGSK